ncbi:YafY family protein [Thiohalophilus sp.]|uniref:helix-turn-helix transcriptional regulator n=1 Tax=Thiohalophilus sp. TaxID=3028392 RepID=UPI002ACE3440|nr:YafY family protein [Thiohalophilus sp.]MDZ7662595.1 YafY family protein [Thiohalophilus sp.]
MDRTERFYKIQQLLESQRAVSKARFLEELAVSEATFKRDLEYLRDRLQAPIVYDPVRRGYRYDLADGDRYVLPGLWFNATELHALLTMQHLLSQVQPGLLTPHIEPLMTRLHTLLDSGDHSYEQVRQRIRILPQGRRPVEPRYFEIISSAVLARHRLTVSYYVRARDETTERELSPQRLLYYRDNWYLDAWCHTRQEFRRFALESIRQVRLGSEPAEEMAPELLDGQLGDSYGIFAGSPHERAVLRFSPERARWVAEEQWHPDQEGRFDEAGYYQLSVPFSDPRELLMDILKFGPDVEVLEPKNLRVRVRGILKKTVQVYE